VGTLAAGRGRCRTSRHAPWPTPELAIGGRQRIVEGRNRFTGIPPENRGPALMLMMAGARGAGGATPFRGPRCRRCLIELIEGKIGASFSPALQRRGRESGRLFVVVERLARFPY